MQSKAFLFALTTSFFWGLAPIFGKVGLAKPDPTVALTFRSVVISIILLIWAGVTGHLGNVYGLATSRVGLFIAAEGICASLLGHLAYYYAIKYGEVSRLVPVAAAFPLITMVLAFLFLSERISLGKVFGAALIVAGVVLIRR